VRLQSRGLKEHTAFFPKLESLFELFYGREGVIDGELVALQEGAPSFPLLMQRCTGSAATAASRAQRIPVVYIPFDILYLNGEDLTKDPLLKPQRPFAEYYGKWSACHAVTGIPQRGRFSL